jgi:tRNA pseudouridine55 synthase
MTIEKFGPFDGALLVDKPAGMTSHDVVDAIRRRFKFQKVGHCGTLDPNATGLLVIVLGKSTKLSDRIMSQDKAYEGIAKFGESTDTFDADGQITATRPVPQLNLDMLNSVASSFIGDLMQVPPMVSAAKKDGVPLYKLARKGIEVERKPKLVHIYDFSFTNLKDNTAEFKVVCTKGTYVRSLIHDLGEKIGCGAHLAALRRTASGSFTVKDSLQFNKLIELPASELQKFIIPHIKLVHSQ